jgi:hypothetical protein
MALLNICVITGNNIVAQVGLMFLRHKKEEDYKWACEYLRTIMTQDTIEEPTSIVTDRDLALIRCLKSQFPSSYHLLCRWHINMNMLAKTKRWFPGPIKTSGKTVRHPQFQDFLSSWNTLLASPTEELYNKKLVEMRAKYPTGAIEYCTKTWLIWRESLVACWINQYYHFGVTVTSPIKGCHTNIKVYLQRGHGDLRGVFNNLKHFWAGQHASIKTVTAQQQFRPLHSINISLFAAVLKQVHGYALQKILQEHAKLPTQGPPLGPAYPSCGCSITQSMGLPYYHKIWQRKTTGRVILLEDIYPH